MPFRMLTTREELEEILVPVLKANGSEIPPIDCYVASVELDEAGKVLAYQMMQNALFLEGMWARDGSAHLLTLYRMCAEFAGKVGAERFMTMTRQDAAGERIGRIAERLGFERMPWNIFRRKL